MGDAHALACGDGFAKMCAMENANYAGGPGKCSEICMPETAVAGGWITDAAEGACEAEGYATVDEETTVQPPMGAALTVHVFTNGAEATAPGTCHSAGGAAAPTGGDEAPAGGEKAE